MQRDNIKKGLVRLGTALGLKALMLVVIWGDFTIFTGAVPHGVVAFSQNTPRVIQFLPR